jgi:glucose-6-phosphate 1-dehydrogenase
MAEVNNQQWRGVPIYIRTGKGLKEKKTEISLIYKGDKAEDINAVTISVQPNEGISIELRAKKPGLESDIQNINLSYNYEESKHHIEHTAYEKLIVDAMRGDQMLFPSTSEVINSWKFIDPFLESWHESKKKPEIYNLGTWGPKGADKLMSARKDAWQN